MLNSLDSFTLLQRGGTSLGRAASNETPKSSQRDIFRYSYNLGKQRTKQLQRTASLAANIGGGINTQTNDRNDSFAKELMRRRTLPRSMSMESGSVFSLDKMRSDTIHELVDGSSNDVMGARTAEMEISRAGNGKSSALDVKPDTSEENSSDAVEDSGLDTTSTAGSESQKNETTSPGGEGRKKSSGNSRPKSASLSESVPDLRIIAHVDKTNCEDFPTFLPPDTSERAQSRPICKLRRAARRLGVSLSSEELYHKQRRNGLCTEIDDAADNRKLLRVLNKRF